MSDFKKVILYAIIPAIIAGLFAVIPKIYDEINEPKALLGYSIIQGPSLGVDGVNKSIVTIQTRNLGKKVLSNVAVHIKSPGKLEAIDVSNSTGLQPKTVKNEDVRITVSKMHPNDHITVSLMLSSKTHLFAPDVALRSDEVIGIESTEKDEKSNSLDLTSGLLSGLSVFVMAIAFIIKTRFGTSLPLDVDKPHTIFYIAARLGLTDIVKSLGVPERNITYLRFSDLLYSAAQENQSQKTAAINGLKSLLLINEIAKSSRTQIERHLKILENNHFDQNVIDELKKKSNSIKGSLSLRDEIDNIINESEVY